MIVSQTIKRARLSRLSTLRSRRHPAINPSVSKTWQFGLVNRKCLTSGSTPLPTVPPISTANLVDLQTSAKIEGEETQIAIIKLQPGQTIRAESGSLIYMTPSIQMETTSNVSDAMKRLLTGQALFVTDFTANHSQGELALGTAFPSKLIRLNLTEYGSLLCQKGAYVASNPTTMIELAFTKSFMSGFFGSEGFVLQKLTGEGDVLVQASGTLVRRDLKEGETLRVSTGSLVCMTSSVDYGE
mmetsp:Transcript_40270/g.56696  ORF Transcript_40270/g.56696 Transcript_40270/m.56696 type:complete len:242 (+) Transcript_40270:46-771(+)